jgi:hypothetical protein
MPQAKGIVTKNRFEMLSRDRSESGVRYRYDSPSKRQREESPVQVDKNAAFTSMAGEEEKLVKAKNLVTRIKSKIEQAKEQKMSGLLWDIVYDMAELLDINTGVQETTANVVVDSYNKVSSPRKSRRDGSVFHKEKEPEMDEETKEKAIKTKKFAQEVREAERSSLIFKSNMGPVSIMNPDTMKKNFTLDLVAKAAAVEKMPAGRPSKDVASQLDDALEMVTKMDFFGKETKKAKKATRRRRRITALSRSGFFSRTRTRGTQRTGSCDSCVAPVERSPTTGRCVLSSTGRLRMPRPSFRTAIFR